MPHPNDPPPNNRLEDAKTIELTDGTRHKVDRVRLKVDTKRDPVKGTLTRHRWMATYYVGQMKRTAVLNGDPPAARVVEWHPPTF